MLIISYDIAFLRFRLLIVNRHITENGFSYTKSIINYNNDVVA